MSSPSLKYKGFRRYYTKTGEIKFVKIRGLSIRELCPHREIRPRATIEAKGFNFVCPECGKAFRSAGPATPAQEAPE